MLEGSPEVLSALAAMGLDRCEAFFDEAVERQVIHRRDDGRTVARLEVPEVGTLYAKRWRRTGLLPLDGPGRRVLEEAENLARCADWGVAVPEVAARGAERGALGLTLTVLVTHPVPGAPVTEHLAAHPEHRGTVISQLGRAYGLLFAQGLSHSSPGTKHVYVRAEPEPEVSLIDVARLPALRPRDLERYELLVRVALGASDPDWEAFWCAFFDVEALGPAERERLAAVVEGAAQRQARRERELREEASR